MESKKKIILVIGPPGVGKGTQSKLMAKKLQRVHISTGDFIRDSIKNRSNFGKQAKPFIDKNLLVPDDILIENIMKHLKSIPGDIILDGFPRTLAQSLNIISEMEVEKVIFLKASNDVCVKRILDRQKDPNSDRKIDTEKKIKERLIFFNETIGEINDLFQGCIQVVDAMKNTDEVTFLIEKIFEIEKKEVGMKIGEEKCVICYGKLADHIVLPCGHQCGCENCLKEQFKRAASCPICRKKIEGVIRVFRAGIVEEGDENIKKQEKIEKNRNKNPLIIKNNNNLNINNKENSFESEVEIAKNLLISVAPCEDIVANNPVNVAVTLKIPDTAVRRAVDVCCVIDISGSMGEHAKYQDPENENKIKTDGMSILDLVKHAVKTVIHTLNENDRLSIVAFDSIARDTFPLTVMNETGRKQAVKALEELDPEESTNIWLGLKTGLDSLRAVKKEKNIHRKKFLYLLTDGQPNISPEGGEAIALKRYFEAFKDFECQVNTFGFGYDLKSSLLLAISVVGAGTFSFIPDAKILGTNFVNAIANAATTLSQNALVKLTAKGCSSFAGEVLGMLQAFFFLINYLV